MASVVLDRIWLHDAADLGTYLTFFSGGPADSRVKDGEVRSYAGGRLRVVSRAGRRQTIPITLRMVTDDQLEQLDEWAGQTLMYRDPRGRLLFGTFFALDVTEYPHGTEYDVAITFQQVTHSIEA